MIPRVLIRGKEEGQKQRSRDNGSHGQRERFEHAVLQVLGAEASDEPKNARVSRSCKETELPWSLPGGPFAALQSCVVFSVHLLCASAVWDAGKQQARPLS